MVDDRALLIGATASDPRSSVPIWNAIRKYLTEAGFPVEYALYSTYDAMCAGLLDGQVDIAWNAPMAHAQSLIQSNGECRTLAMRDTDNDRHTFIVTLTESGITDLDGLRGCRLALGMDTSSELWLLPVAQLAEAGFDVRTDCTLVELEPTQYDNLQSWVDDAAIFAAVADGRADAGAIFEPWLPALIRRAGMTDDDITEVWRTRPYSHCAFTARPGLDDDTCSRFVDLLVAMDPADPDIAEMMRMEQLTKWVRAEDTGWQDLIDAINGAGLAGKLF